MAKIKNDRVPTGIQGFDKLVDGGFPMGANVLIVGGPGSGKTIFCLQYLYNGVAKNNENGLYITFEESKQRLVEQAVQFGWDFEKLEKEKKLFFHEVEIKEINKKLFDTLKELVQKNNIKRIAVDSLSDICFSTKMSLLYGAELQPGAVTNEYQVRGVIQVLVKEIGKFGCTNLFVSDSVEKGPYITRDGVSEFVCDGVIKIEFEKIESGTPRTLKVIKMRKTNQDLTLQALKITSKGISLSAFEGFGK